MKFSPAVDTVVKETKSNPKRIQREAKKQMQETGIGTKSQQALKLQQEQNKIQVERIIILLTLPFRGDDRILLVKITRRIFL